MSKIGRKPIGIDKLTIDIKGQDIHYKGPYTSGIYNLVPELRARVENNTIYLTASKLDDISQKEKSMVYRQWGLHRALLANTLYGAAQEFEKKIEIHGLGYKATLDGKKILFTLGYSHKIDKEIPTGISVEIDKSGQKITVKSSNKNLAGQFCSEVRSLRVPEPYKGKGIKLQEEVIMRKSAGKGKK